MISTSPKCDLYCLVVYLIVLMSNLELSGPESEFCDRY